MPEELLRPFAGAVTVELHVTRSGLHDPRAVPVLTAAPGQNAGRAVHR